MKAEEAIKRLWFFNEMLASEYANKHINLEKHKEDTEEIVNLIIELEKYKQIHEEIVDEFAGIEQMNLSGDKYTYENIITTMNRVKEKYFPKTFKKTVTIEIEAENTRDMGNALTDIGNFVSANGESKMKIIDIGKMKQEE